MRAAFRCRLRSGAAASGLIQTRAKIPKPMPKSGRERVIELARRKT
jgi:hypothetical protein